MRAMDRLYLDNAATSFPKPPCVHEAMLRYATEVGASPGRGAYAEAREGAAIIAECRRRLCRLIGAQDPNQIVFTLNTTDALNLAIKGVALNALALAAGAARTHMVTTAMDHNSVLRPFNALRALGVEWTRVPVDPNTGIADPAEVARAIRPETSLVAVVHASNVTGALQPVADIGEACARRGIPLLVDAAQSVGHIPLDINTLNIDFLACPGHKGLLGPLGVGALWIRPGREALLRLYREGGTGSVSEQDTQPTTMPDRFEPGSHNTVGIVGLHAALGWILEQGVDRLARHERTLTHTLLTRLAEVPDLRILGPTRLDQRVGVVSVTHEAIPAENLAERLEAEHGVLTRAGLHCAPHAHATHGTLERGACRLSVGPFLTQADVERAAEAVASVCEAAVSA